MSNAPAGWYDDGSGNQRWWNGTAWAEGPELQRTDPVGEPQPPAEARTQPRKGLAIAALCVGAVAFLSGLVPGLGIMAGVSGIVLGTIAYLKKQPKALAVTGLALAGLGAAASLGMTVGMATANRAPIAEVESSATSDAPAADPKPADGSKPEPMPELKADKTAKPKPAEKPKPSADPKPAEKPKPAPEPKTEKPAGPTAEEKTQAFDRALKDGLGIDESYQEALVMDPSLWAGYVVGVRVDGDLAYVTLQVDRNTPDGQDLGQRAAKAISTLILQETVDTLKLSWVVVEDGTGTVIDQKAFSPFF